jgi:hypothetical protein
MVCTRDRETLREQYPDLSWPGTAKAGRLESRTAPAVPARPERPAGSAVVASGRLA